jgi:hypothetical protein
MLADPLTGAAEEDTEQLRGSAEPHGEPAPSPSKPAAQPGHSVPEQAPDAEVLGTGTPASSLPAARLGDAEADAVEGAAPEHPAALLPEPGSAGSPLALPTDAAAAPAPDQAEGTAESSDAGDRGGGAGGEPAHANDVSGQPASRAPTVAESIAAALASKLRCADLQPAQRGHSAASGGLSLHPTDAWVLSLPAPLHSARGAQRDHAAGAPHAGVPEPAAGARGRRDRDAHTGLAGKQRRQRRRRAWFRRLVCARGGCAGCAPALRRLAWQRAGAGCERPGPARLSALAAAPWRLSSSQRRSHHCCRGARRNTDLIMLDPSCLPCCKHVCCIA